MRFCPWTPFALSLTLAALPLAAQQAAATAPVTEPAFMTTAPQPGPVKPYTPPSSHQDQLPNGLRIVVVPDHRFPLITVRLALRAGGSRLTPAQAGLADAEAELLTAGTPTRSELQIAQTMDGLGGSLAASVDPDFLTVSASALSSRAPELFELLADVVLHPTFPQKEVDLRKANMVQELAANRADAGFLASVEFFQLLFGHNPYAITAPTDASIAAITRDALVKFHDDYFLPNNQAEVVVTGDIDAARGHNLVQQYFGDWKIGRPMPPPAPPPPLRDHRQIAVIERPNSAQSTIVLGNLGLTRTAPNYFPFMVANQVLGGSFNSRLIADIREKKGYAYDIGSTNDPFRDYGAWWVSTQVRTAVTTAALQDTLTQLEAMRSEPITAAELQQAKNYLTGNFVLGLQTQAEVAGEEIVTGLYGLPPDRLATWVGDVEAVSADQAEAAAKANIQPATDLIVVVGDVHSLEAQLAALSPGVPLTLYNDKGEPVGTYPAAAAGGH